MLREFTISQHLLFLTNLHRYLLMYAGSSAEESIFQISGAEQLFQYKTGVLA